MRRWRGIGRGLAGAVALGLVLVVVGTPRSGRMGTVAAGEVVVEPDLAGVELPPNLAPLSFRFRASASAYGVRVQGSHGAPLAVTSRRSSLRLPARQWRALLVANRGGELSVTTAVQDHSGRWQGLTRRCRVGAEPIDRYVVYRLLRPLHNTWGSVGIYQRDLSGFTERVAVRPPAPAAARAAGRAG